MHSSSLRSTVKKDGSCVDHCTNMKKKNNMVNMAVFIITLILLGVRHIDAGGKFIIFNFFNCINKSENEWLAIKITTEKKTHTQNEWGWEDERKSTNYETVKKSYNIDV